MKNQKRTRKTIPATPTLEMGNLVLNTPIADPLEMDIGTPTLEDEEGLLTTPTFILEELFSNPPESSDMVCDVREEVVESITVSPSINSFNPVAEEMFNQLVANPSVVLTKLTPTESALVIQQLAGGEADDSGVGIDLIDIDEVAPSKELWPSTQEDVPLPPGREYITFYPSNGVDETAISSEKSQPEEVEISTEATRSEVADMEASEKPNVDPSSKEDGSRDDGPVNTIEEELESLPPEQQSSEAVADLFETLATQEQQPVPPK